MPPKKASERPAFVAKPFIEDLLSRVTKKDSDRSIVNGIISNVAAGRYWQTNLQVIYGYSGAPVFAMDGRVIGVVAGGTPSCCEHVQLVSSS